MKKKFLPYFVPARYIDGYRAYINLAFETKTGERLRKKPTYKLGFIKNQEERRKRGEALAILINWWLSNGYWYEDFSEKEAIERKKQKELAIFQPVQAISEKSKTNILVAIKEAGELKKLQTKKRSSVNNINSDVRLLCGFLKKKGLEELTILDFTKEIAISYLVYYLNDRGCSNGTYNNVISCGRKLLTPIVELGYLPINPFSKLRTLQAEEPQIRNFEPEESKLIRDYIYENDRLLFYALIFQLGCYIRPNELRFLKFEDILLEEGLIRIKADNSKMSTTRFPTIPDQLIRFFKEEHFQIYPKNYYIFGAKRKANPTKPIGRDYHSKQHKKILDLLHEEGKLPNRKNLKFYSWKYTGITIGIDTLGLVFAKDQAGHAKVDTTMKYRRKRVVNEKMKKLNVL